jgi:fatty acid desaturase
MSERLKRLAGISLVVLMVVVPASVVGIAAAYWGICATLVIMGVGGFFVLWVIGIMNAKPEEKETVTMEQVLPLTPEEAAQIKEQRDKKEYEESVSHAVGAAYIMS